MNEPVVVDVFKFVAVRPAQKVSRQDAKTVLIHDARAGTPDGQATLRKLARRLTAPDNATALLERLDMSDLEPLAEAHADLVRSYAAATPEQPVDLTRMARDLGIDGTLGDPRRATDAAWDALYIAYATGPSAGAALETPTAALRVLHLGGLAQGGRPAAPVAIDALHARPVVPVIMTPGSTNGSPNGHPVDTPPAAAIDQAETGQVRDLIDELVRAQSLLNEVRRAPVIREVVRRETHAEGDPAADRPDEPAAAGARRRSRMDVALTTAPTVTKVLRRELAGSETRLLDRLGITTAPVPAASQALQTHANDLTQQIFALRDAPGVMDLLMSTDVARLGIGIGALVPGRNRVPRDDPSTAADVDVSGRIRPLGVGDLKVVKQKLLAYEPGEVAHIENILKKETKQRVFRNLDRQEVTFFESEETTEERTHDTQTTDRFELKKEAEKTIKEDLSIQAGVTVTGGFGPVTITAHGDFAYSTSKQESEKSSSNFARDVVDRTISKVQKKTRTERTTKTFHETEETDTHGFDNTGGTEHVVGVYRWVDKRYRAQIYNYGKRLMLEFVVPEPAAFYRAAQHPAFQVPADLVPPEPLVGANGKPLTADNIDETNYKQLASRYNAAGVAPPPPEWAYLSAALEQNEIANGHTLSKAIKDIVIPDGYTFQYYNAFVTLIWENHPRFSIQIGESQHVLASSTAARDGLAVEVGVAQDPGEWDNAKGPMPITAVGYDINAYAATIAVNASRDFATLYKWQIDTFGKIATAYQALKTAYDQKVAAARAQADGVQIQGHNPGFNREVEKRELKKLCLEMLTGQHFNGFDAMTDPTDSPAHLPEVDVYEAMSEGPIIQFFEQAFDWEQITYLFYPYFWTHKKHWVKLSNLDDPDPLFSAFLQAGAARVVLPVSPAYNDAMLYFLQTRSANVRDRIWQGGQPPTIDDPLFKSIADEIRAQTDDLGDATPEGDPWEYTLPTTLVWLQPDGTLPVYSA